MRCLRFLSRPIRTYYRAKKHRSKFNICINEQVARGNGKHGFGKRISSWLKLFTRINDEQSTWYTGQSDAERILADITFLCTQTDGTRGIWKRIDETRELFVCIEELGPEFLERCPWVEGWLSYQYSFLTSLRTLLNLPIQMEGFDNFPRPFPSSRFEWEATYEHLVESSRSKVLTRNDVDGVFIVLSSSNRILYSFSVELGCNISEGISLIKVIKVDYECIAYDLLKICYGIHDGFVSDNVGELPAFFLPVKETVNYKEHISCNTSVIGHIKYCLLFTLELLKKEKEIPLDMIKKIRSESIGNFRLSRPISL